MASTVVVGPTNCQPALVHFADIQSAINASPQGGIVLVCAGVYSQQLSIYHPITIKGIDYNGSNMALLTMPPGGEFAQIYVQATGVNLTDLTIDGTNNGGICGEGPYGIWYNGGTSYTICGGYSLNAVNNFANQNLAIGQAYMVDYDSATGVFSNWASFSQPFQHESSCCNPFSIRCVE